jgi:chaperone modulatory protein CbpM
MIDEFEICRRAGINVHTLRGWMEADWIHPGAGDEDGSFSEMDVARAQLICDLAGPMGVNSEGVAVILSLLDQIHGLRRTLRRMNSLIIGQEAPVRDRIMYAARVSEA